MSYVSFGWSGEGERVIKVSLQDGKWMTTHYIDGEPDQQLIRLFGSNTLPTPWAEETDMSTVVEELAARNSHAKVS